MMKIKSKLALCLCTFLFCVSCVMINSEVSSTLFSSSNCDAEHQQIENYTEQKPPEIDLYIVPPEMGEEEEPVEEWGV